MAQPGGRRKKGGFPDTSICGKSDVLKHGGKKKERDRHTHS